jgi:hypothetical protein
MDEGQVDKEKYLVKIARRPWYEWIFLGFWLIGEIILVQSAIASGQEFEPRAAGLFWILSGILFFGGVIFWLVRTSKWFKE